MATPRSSVSICRDGDTLFCRVEGWGTMNQAPVLRQHAEACLAQGASRLRIDLRNCDYMDSTFLGSLICLSRQFGQRAADGFGLVQPAAPCRDLLAKMKLTAV